MLWKIQSLLILLLCTKVVHAQPENHDTLFYNIEGNIVQQSKANYYKLFFSNNTSTVITEKTFFTNHTLRTVTHYKDKNRIQKTDTSKAFYPTGSINWIIAYNEKGETLSLKQYHKNGQLKRIEKYRLGTFYKGKKYNEKGKRVRFTRFQQTPKYNGGYERMIAYLNRTIQYPKLAQVKDIKGTVIVSFVVTKAGDISKIKIIKSIHPLLDKEAKRVVSIMKQWIPGKTNDIAVNSRVSIPITFGKPVAKSHIPVRN